MQLLKLFYFENKGIFRQFYFQLEDNSFSENENILSYSQLLYVYRPPHQ